jgi:hypothetical protein
MYRGVESGATGGRIRTRLIETISGSKIAAVRIQVGMIRKLKSGEFRLYSQKKNESTGKRRNLGTFDTLEKAKQHERAVQYFKRH